MKRLILLLCVAFLRPVSGQSARVLVNHLGYECTGYKKAVVQVFGNDSVYECSVLRYTEKTAVMNVVPEKQGPVEQWDQGIFWFVDFSHLSSPGEYVLQCTCGSTSVESFPFKVQKDILERHTLTDIIFYFRGQRCTGPFNRADAAMTFDRGRKDTVDVRGGWFDATGDYSKNLSHLSFSTFFNPQQTPFVVYSLGKSLDMLEQSGDANFTQIQRRMEDEFIFGADFLVRMRNPGGSFYRAVSARGPGKKAEDRRITPTMRNFTITKLKRGMDPIDSKQRSTTVYDVGYRAGGGLAIAALAMAAHRGYAGEFPVDTYLQCARKAFDFLAQNNLMFTNDGKENIVDDYCALTAATELFKATGSKQYKKAADKRARSLMNRIVSWEGYRNYLGADSGDRPFFHAADAGLPAVALLEYMDICREQEKKEVKAAVRKIMEFELAVTQEVYNPFGYARQLVQDTCGNRYTSFFFPHNTETAPWWQGENARLASLAAAARLTAHVFSLDTAFCARLSAYAQNQLDWILGCNPFDACMLDGTGRNNPEYMFFGSYQYTCAPGGICNGITSGLDNRRGIAFNLFYEQTGKDYDWRWAEQWLPHAAWYMMAVCAGQEERR